MLNRSDMRPAYATVGQNSSADNGSNVNYAAFSAAQTEDDDFNSFGDTSAKPHASTPKKQEQRTKPARKSAKKGGKPVSPKLIIIGVAAVVALVLVIALLVAIFSSPGKNILRKDNVYAVFTDADNVHHVVNNGKVIEQDFSGEIELVPAKDNSFAYIFEKKVSEDDGASVTNMYVLEGKKLSMVEAEADEIIAYADYEPGIIFKEGNLVVLHSKDSFEEISSDASASNFLISGDATTVVYTELTGKDGDKNQVKYFRRSGFNDIGDAETDALKPVAISNDGRYVYATDATNAFYYLDVTKRGAEYKQNTIIASTANVFGAVTAMNADGTEVIFNYTDANGNIGSFIYEVGDKAYKEIAAGTFFYTPSDKEVVCPATFLDEYFVVTRTVTDEEGNSRPVTSTFHYGNKGATKLADTIGQFSPDGKFFYFTEATVGLVRVSLNNTDFEQNSKVIARGAIDSFVITEKGDIYHYTKPTKNSGGRITFREASSDNTTKSITNRPDADSMFLCGNSVYFSETQDGEIKLYRSTGGSSKEEVTFKKVLVDSPLTITMGAGDKGYACLTDIDGNTKLLYTSNGKTFDVVCDSCVIPGYNADAILPEESGTDNNTSSTDDSESEDE